MLGRLGKKHAEMAAAFITTAIGFGGTAAIAIVYFTDWKIIVTKIPYYNGKFKDIKTE